MSQIRPDSIAFSGIRALYHIRLILTEYWVLGTICSAFGSSLLILLYVKCMVLVLGKHSQRSQRMRYFFATYMTTMMLLSLCQTTVDVAFAVGSIRYLFFTAGNQYFSPRSGQMLLLRFNAPRWANMFDHCQLGHGWVYGECVHLKSRVWLPNYHLRNADLALPGTL